MTYSVALECAVAQRRANVDAAQVSRICWFQMLEDLEPHIVVPEKPFQQSVTQHGEFVMRRSVLMISETNPPTSSHMYWCQLCTADRDTRSNLSTPEVAATRLTIYEPEFYVALPLCPQNTTFHLAESVCVNNETVSQDSPPNCTLDNSCDGEDSEDTFPLRTAVIAGGSVVGMVVVLLAVAVTVLCYLLLRRRKEKRGDSQKDRGIVNVCMRMADC